MEQAYTNTVWAALTLASHSGTVRCLHLHKNRLVSGSSDRTIKVREWVELTSEWVELTSEWVELTSEWHHLDYLSVTWVSE